MTYQKNDEVMVYTYIGKGLTIKIPFDKGVITGKMRFLDNATYYQVDVLGCGWMFVHEDNLSPYNDAIKHHDNNNILINAEMGWNYE